jgi:SAM-dependent methyltransferase
MRRVLDAASLIAGWLGKRKRIRPRSGPVKVNLGSGLTVAVGWINVDGSPNALLAFLPSWLLRRLYRFSEARNRIPEAEYVAILRNHFFVHHNVEYGLPFEDGTVDFVFSSHLLEHLYPEVGERLLREAFRVLKKGGRIRVCVPDLEHVLSLYRRGEKDRALGFLFMPETSPYFSRHRYMYDFQLLEEKLRGAGFTYVERCTFGVGGTPDVETLDVKPDQTLFVEAVKEG